MTFKKKKRKDTDIVLKVNALEQNTHFPSLSAAKLLARGGCVFFWGRCRAKAGTADKGAGLRGHLLSSQMGALHLDESLLGAGKKMDS